jgi:nitrile hydratase accessory protein
MHRDQDNFTDRPEVIIDDNEPVFHSPWEAKAFAMVNHLAAKAHCSWSEWTDYLTAEITATEQDAPGSKAYYEQWMAACEKLLIEKGIIEAQAINQRVDDLIAEQESEHQHVH